MRPPIFVALVLAGCPAAPASPPRGERAPSYDASPRGGAAADLSSASAPRGAPEGGASGVATAAAGTADAAGAPPSTLGPAPPPASRCTTDADCATCPMGASCKCLVGTGRCVRLD